MITPLAPGFRFFYFCKIQLHASKPSNTYPSFSSRRLSLVVPIVPTNLFLSLHLVILWRETSASCLFVWHFFPSRFIIWPFTRAPYPFSLPSSSHLHQDLILSSSLFLFRCLVTFCPLRFDPWVCFPFHGPETTTLPRNVQAFTPTLRSPQHRSCTRAHVSAQCQKTGLVAYACNRQAGSDPANRLKHKNRLEQTRKDQFAYCMTFYLLPEHRRHEI